MRKIPTGRAIVYPKGTASHGRNIDDRAPEAYIARTLFREIGFKLGLSILSPRTGTNCVTLEMIGRPSLTIAGRPKK
jgi:hypothetical protein